MAKTPSRSPGTPNAYYEQNPPWAECPVLQRPGSTKSWAATTTPSSDTCPSACGRLAFYDEDGILPTTPSPSSVPAVYMIAPGLASSGQDRPDPAALRRHHRLQVQPDHGSAVGAATMAPAAPQPALKLPQQQYYTGKRSRSGPRQDRRGQGDQEDRRLRNGMDRGPRPYSEFGDL